MKIPQILCQGRKLDANFTKSIKNVSLYLWLSHIHKNISPISRKNQRWRLESFWSLPKLHVEQPNFFSISLIQNFWDRLNFFRCNTHHAFIFSSNIFEMSFFFCNDSISCFIGIFVWTISVDFLFLSVKII